MRSGEILRRGRAFIKRPRNPVKDFFRSRDDAEQAAIRDRVKGQGSPSFSEVLEGKVGFCPERYARVLREFGYPGDPASDYRDYVLERAFQDFFISEDRLSNARRVLLYLYVSYQAQMKELMKDLHLGVRGAQEVVRNLRKLGLIRRSRGKGKPMKYRLETDLRIRIKEVLPYFPSLQEDVYWMMELRRVLGKTYLQVLPEEFQPGAYIPLESFPERREPSEEVTKEKNPLARFYFAQASDTRRAILEDVRRAWGTEKELKAVISGKARYCPKRVAEAFEKHGYPGDASGDYRAFKVRAFIEKLSSEGARDRLRVIAYLFAAYSATCKEISEDLKLDFDRLKALVYKMRDEGIVRKLSTKKEFVHWRLSTDFRVEFAECVRKGQFLDEVFEAMEVRKAKGKPCLELFP